MCRTEGNIRFQTVNRLGRPFLIPAGRRLAAILLYLFRSVPTRQKY